MAMFGSGNRDGLRIILKKSKPERGSVVTSPDLRLAGPENLQKVIESRSCKKLKSQVDFLARHAKPLRENCRARDRGAGSAELVGEPCLVGWSPL